MRTNLFLSTLFAVSAVLVGSGGAALAEKPHDAAKAPRAIEHLRSHGDTVDKTYRASDKAPAGEAASSTPATTTTHTKSAVDKGSARINCSESGADCSASHGDTHAAGAEASAKGSTYAVRAPAFMDKILGSDRTNFNEAGEDEGMNRHAVKRAWSHVGAERGSTGTIPLAVQKQNVRLDQQASSDRMSCNDADECMMSSKAAKKNWAYNSIKAGTWQGPEAVGPSNAERAIAEQKAGASKTATKTADHAAHAQAVQHENDHQH
jgi:hypothetical protein